MPDPNHPQRAFGVVPQAEAVALSGLDFLTRILEGAYPGPPVGETADFWPVSVELGRVVFEGQPSARFHNPMGMVHGGWITTLLDSAMACAVHSTLPAGQAYTTLELKTNFVRPVSERSGPVRCEGTVVHKGGRVATAEGKLFDAAGKLLAHGTETCLIMDVGPAR
jgi:uncharacterized protein (TIGR00369 family)